MTQTLSQLQVIIDLFNGQRKESALCWFSLISWNLQMYRQCHKNTILLNMIFTDIFKSDTTLICVLRGLLKIHQTSLKCLSGLIIQNCQEGLSVSYTGRPIYMSYCKRSHNRLCKDKVGRTGKCHYT